MQLVFLREVMGNTLWVNPETVSRIEFVAELHAIVYFVDGKSAICTLAEGQAFLDEHRVLEGPLS